MYTTHSYNKWHQTSLSCPLSTQPIHDEFHVIFDSSRSATLDTNRALIIKTLFHSAHGAREDIRVTGDFPSCHPEELAHVCYEIYQQETLAYHNKQGLLNETKNKVTYNTWVHQEVSRRLLYYKHIGCMDIFYKYYPINEAFVNKNLQITTVFQV